MKSRRPANGRAKRAAALLLPLLLLVLCLFLTGILVLLLQGSSDQQGAPGEEGGARAAAAAAEEAHAEVEEAPLPPSNTKLAFLFIARNRLPLDLVWDAFFRVRI
jgi:hypothetical protein